MTKQFKANQPIMFGYNASGIKNWSPETEQTAKYFRSRVPLAERIAPFSATQANPDLSTEPQVMNLSADYDKAKTAVRYDDKYSANLLNFWQYTDLYGSWHGLALEDTDEDEPVYGLLNIPNPGYTDAAHRNGVLSLGCWFWPREEEDFADIVEQKADGSFPVADKMIEMALYFGFDGYFINQEDAISEEHALQLLDMMKYLRENSPEYFHLQWYDTVILDGRLRYQNQFNDVNDPWIVDQKTGKSIIHSMFINYAWNEKRVQDSHDHAVKIGLDPNKALFISTEHDKYGYNPPYDARLIFPEGKKAMGAIGLFGTDFTWNRYPNKHDANDQNEVYLRERRFWTGPLEDPTDRIGRTLYKPYRDPFHQVDRENYRKWDGMAHYIPARSVIGSYPFVTRFNTGHGKKFFLDGEVAREEEWYNASIQDILPSWQWWIQRFDESGKAIKETRAVSERPLVPSLTHEDACDGGSSLQIKGTLEQGISNELRLFKTKLDVTQSVNLSLSYKIGQTDTPSHIEVGLIFEDNPSEFVYLPVGASEHDGWNTKTINLGDYAGRTIATIGLRFASDSRKEVDILIGELALTNASPITATQPTDFKVDKAYEENDVAEVYLSWHFENDQVWYYDIYRTKADGSKEAIGRIYDDVYYVKSLKRSNNEDTTPLQLVSVSLDGTISSAAETTYTWSK